MTGVFWAAGPCWSCGEVFSFDPDTVDSVPIDPKTSLPPDIKPRAGGYERAVKRPICEECMGRVRLARGGEY